MRWLLRLLPALGLALLAAPPTNAVEKQEIKPRVKVSYYREIRPILQANCQGCHQPAKNKGGYLMTGADLHRDSQMAWWPLARDPLPLESSQPGVFVAGDVRHGSIKRVAAAVGEGAMAIALLHTYLAEDRNGE